MTEFLDFIIEKRAVIIPFMIGLLALSPAIYFLDQKEKDRYVEESGRVIAVYAEDGINLEAEVVKGEESIKKNIYISSNKGADEEKAEVSESRNAAGEMNAALYHIEKELGQKAERGNGELIYLPENAEDDMDIRWYRPQSGRTYLLPILMMPLIPLFIYREGKDREKKRRKEDREEIVAAIPGFSDRLLLLMGCGLIYEDAFERIAEEYMKRRDNDAFGNLIIRSAMEAKATNSESIAFLTEYAGRLKIKEFSRMVGLISDNRYRGADLSDKLRQESNMLWNERRKRAEELGKAAETKLSMPTAMMLLALIAVTAAPAMMQM